MKTFREFCCGCACGLLCIILGIFTWELVTGLIDGEGIKTILESMWYGAG